MKLEQLFEAMEEHDRILHKLLALSNMAKTKGLPFGQTSWSIGGKNMGLKPMETNNSILAMLGAKGRYDIKTVNEPSTNAMAQAVQKFIGQMTPGGSSRKDFKQANIKELAATIYNWSKEMQEKGHTK